MGEQCHRGASVFALCGAALAGAFIFLSVAGLAPLQPSNLAWLLQRDADPLTYYVGWSFFRATPWGWPPGANPAYGMELAAGIFHADLIPLLALPLKLFAPAEGPFQYFGWWLLSCFVLQAIFAARLVAIWVPSTLGQIVAAALFCMMPMLWARAAVHFALTAHWLILAGLWLNLKPGVAPRRWLAWVVLAFLAALVQAYLLVMVLGLWGADLARRVLIARSSLLGLALELTVVPLAVAGALFLAGFFLGAGDSLSDGGFGFYRANLLTLVSSGGWSHLIPGIPQGPGDYEGFAFLGMGGLGLLALAVVLWLSRVSRWCGRWRLTHCSWWPLIGLILMLSLFALSNRLALGPWEVWGFRLPSQLADAVGILRASGRFIWPLAYLLLVWSVVSVLRLRPALVGLALLAIAVLAQAADLSPARHSLGVRYTPVGSAPATPLTDPFWREAARHYGAVRYVPPGNRSPSWAALSVLALDAGVPTDAVYLARVSRTALATLHAMTEDALRSGRFAENALYVLDDAAFRRAAITVDTTRDLLARIDGLNVLAPGWLTQRPVPESADVRMTDLFPLLTAGEALRFSPGTAGIHALAGGWSTPEPWGVWSDGHEARLLIRVPSRETESVALRFYIRALLTPQHPQQRVSVRAGGDVVAQWIFTAANNEHPRDVRFPAGTLRSFDDGKATLQITFDLPDAVRPREIGLNEDTRLLAIAPFALELVQD